MIRNKTVIFLSLLLVSINVYAQNELWTDLQQVKAVQVMNDGGFIIMLDSNKASPCQQGAVEEIGFSPVQNQLSFAGAKSLLSAALIAFTTQQKVKVQYTYSMAASYCWGKSLYLVR